jgi:hypothetical protein
MKLLNQNRVKPKAEEILEKFAKKNMIQWNQESFKRTHSKLHRTMIEAITEALSSHSVVEQKEQLPKSEKLCRKNQNFVCNCTEDSDYPNF